MASYRQVYHHPVFQHGGLITGRDGIWAGNMFISACRLARSAISTATPMLFSESRNPMGPLGILPVLTGSGKSKIVAAKPEVLISQLVDTLGTRFQRLLPCFLGPAIHRTMASYRQVYHHPVFQHGGLITGRDGIWAGNMFISACRLARSAISTATPMFSESQNPMGSLGLLPVQTGSGKSKIVAAKPEVLISQLVDTLGTWFQRLPPCFLGPAIHRTH